MLREEALGKLGLGNEASTTSIKEAIVAKRERLNSALAKAPTDALKEKYNTQLQHLAEIEQVLTASSSPSSSSPGSLSGLSQTKLADLPQSATHFDDGPTAQINLRAGQTLAGRYEIREQIGAGGMGAVYRALDNTTGKEIALKVLLPALMKNGRARERFLDEARISQQLSHPNIVNVYDVQQDGDFFFLTMELLEGQDLRQVMDNRKLARQPFDRQEVLEILNPLCEALAYAHQYTVHRDIKPENIWIGEDGSLKVMDFGIARAQSTSQRTQTGAAMGTAYYMAPEQLKGQKEIDGRADMYSVAVMAYELLSGEVPAGMIQPLQKQRKGIPRKLADVIHQGLASRPEGRLADIQAFRVALQKSAKGGFELNLPWKGIGIAAGVLVALLGIGSVGVSGSMSLEGLKELLPMSAEEKAQHEARLAKLQGEIRVLKQRLETARRKLDSDVRDAQRNKSSDINALKYAQEVTESAIFNGGRIGELEGTLSMAETLLRKEQYGLSQEALESVKVGYKSLNAEFSAGLEVYAANSDENSEKLAWEKLGIETSPPHQSVTQAESARRAAKSAEAKGRFSEAVKKLAVAKRHWGEATIAGRKTLSSKVQAEKSKRAWYAAKKKYGLADPTIVKKAREKGKFAVSNFAMAKFSDAREAWMEESDLWQKARESKRGEINRVEAKWQAEAAAEKRRKAAIAEAKRKEEARKRLIASKKSEYRRLSSRFERLVESNSYRESKRSEICFYDFSRMQSTGCKRETHVEKWSNSVQDQGICKLRINNNQVGFDSLRNMRVEHKTDRKRRGPTGGYTYKQAVFNLSWYTLKDVRGRFDTTYLGRYESRSQANQAKQLLLEMKEACSYI